MNATAYELWDRIKKSSDRSVYVGKDKSAVRAYNELKNAGFIPWNSYIDINGVLHCPQNEAEDK